MADSYEQGLRGYWYNHWVNFTGIRFEVDSSPEYHTTDIRFDPHIQRLWGIPGHGEQVRLQYASISCIKYQIISLVLRYTEQLKHTKWRYDYG